MKYLLCIILVAGFMRLQAQDQYPNPEYANHPYFFDKGTKQLTALEKSSAKISSKVKALGYGGMSTLYVIEGGSSAVNIPSADTIEFVVTGGNMMMDPSQMFSLYELDAKKNSRAATIAQGGGLLGKNKKKEKISCLLKKVNDKYVLVVPVKLEAGQYAFINTVPSSAGGGMDQTFDAYCFAVK